MSEAVRLVDPSEPLARILASAILANRAASPVDAPAQAPALGRPDEVQATVAAVLVRYAEVMARLADA